MTPFTVFLVFAVAVVIAWRAVLARWERTDEGDE